MSSYVKVYHGPCDSFDTVAHKPQNLKGLKDRLQKRGYRVDFKPVAYVNYCVLEMCGHQVFACNLKNLKFNTPYENDKVCQRAVDAVEEASLKFKRAHDYLWFWNLIEQEMFNRTKYAPTNTWPSDVEIPKFASCIDCIKCCGFPSTGIKETADEE